MSPLFVRVRGREDCRTQWCILKSTKQVANKKKCILIVYSPVSCVLGKMSNLNEKVTPVGPGLAIIVDKLHRGL